MSLPTRERRRHFWFGVLFIVVGLIPAGMAAFSFRNWQRSQSWVEVQAEVLSVEMRRTGRQQRGRGSLKLFVEYEYNPPFEEEIYQSSGVSPFHRITFFESDTRDEAARLREAMRDGERVICYVNPDSPAEAFLDRDFRWPPLLLLCGVAVLFSGVGALLAWRARDPNYEPPASRMS